MFFERSVEIRNGFDIDQRTNFFDRIGGGLQQRISVIHLLFVEIIGDRFPCCFFESAADIFFSVGEKPDDRLLRRGKVFRRGKQSD